jgi:hypothetical protein
MQLNFEDRLKARIHDPILILSIILALLGVWMSVPGLLIGSGRTSPEDAGRLAQSRLGPTRAVAAARIALIRGDLWATAVEILRKTVRTSAGRAESEVSESAKERLSSACRHALSLAPVSPRLWAICAPYCGDRGASNCVSRYIEMSYFTGPYSLESMPDRLRTAMSIDFGLASDLKMLVAADINFILRREPALKPDLVASYSSALSGNKAAIFAQIREVDPAFAATFR